MGKVIHQTIPLQVWVDIDEGIADVVRYLNTIPGVWTHTSCQGTIGEGGPAPYRAHVDVSWETEEALVRLQHEFEVFLCGEAWGIVYAHALADDIEAEIQSLMQMVPGERHTYMQEIQEHINPDPTDDDDRPFWRAVFARVAELESEGAA
jgi:hypothetical protein